MTEQNEQPTTAELEAKPTVPAKKAAPRKMTAKKTTAAKGKDAGTSSSSVTSASAPKAAAALKASRKPWTAPALVCDPRTGKYSIPEALLRGPRKEVNAHSKALIAALQVMVDAYNGQIDSVTKANNVVNNTQTIMQGSVDQVKKLQGEVAALQRTLGVIGQALRCFGGEFNSQWVDGTDETRKRVTSFQPYKSLLTTFTTRASVYATDTMTVGSSKDCAAKLRMQNVAVSAGRILLEGINTLQSSERYAANPEEFRRTLDKKVLEEIYAPDDCHHGVFVTTLGGFKDLLKKNVDDELDLAEKIFGPEAAQRLRTDMQTRLPHGLGKSAFAANPEEFRLITIDETHRPNPASGTGNLG